MTTQQQWPIELSPAPVTLRPWRLQDRRAWNEIRQRNAAWTAPGTRPVRHDSIEPPLTFAGMVRQFNRRARLGQMLPFAVDYRPDGQAWVLAGQLTISGITRWLGQLGASGLWVDQRWAGRGIIPTALALAVDHCFFTLHLHRMEVAIRPENVRSLRVVEKLGFRHEGNRARYMHVDGDWRDHEMFALHADEVGPGLLARFEHSA